LIIFWLIYVINNNNRTDGSQANQTVLFVLSNGYLLTNVTVQDQTSHGPVLRQTVEQNAIVYIDYANLLVFFSCYPTYDMGVTVLHRRFLVLVRSRTPDCTHCATGITPLIQLGVDAKSFSYVYNGPNCSN
jgi:hypothetical protein